MSNNKASVFLPKQMTGIYDMNNITNNNKNNKSVLTTVLTYSIIVVVVIILITWLSPQTKTEELFGPDDITSRDSFPAHINSSRSVVCDSGRCHKSILKTSGYIRPFGQSKLERKRDRKKKNVRWSDTLVMYAEE
jgi:hypothetical protein